LKITKIKINNIIKYLNLKMFNNSRKRKSSDIDQEQEQEQGQETSAFSKIEKIIKYLESHKIINNIDDSHYPTIMDYNRIIKLPIGFKPIQDDIDDVDDVVVEIGDRDSDDEVDDGYGYYGNDGYYDDDGDGVVYEANEEDDEQREFENGIANLVLLANVCNSIGH